MIESLLFAWCLLHDSASTALCGRLISALWLAYHEPLDPSGRSVPARWVDSRSPRFLIELPRLRIVTWATWKLDLKAVKMVKDAAERPIERRVIGRRCVAQRVVRLASQGSNDARFGSVLYEFGRHSLFKSLYTPLCVKLLAVMALFYSAKFADFEKSH